MLCSLSNHSKLQSVNIPLISSLILIINNHRAIKCILMLVTVQVNTDIKLSYSIFKFAADCIIVEVYLNCVLFSRHINSNNYIVPGFNDYAKDLHYVTCFP